jgi:hypothetical protein
LAERVLESSATKLKPYLIQAVETLGISFDDYSKVVASICQETSGTAEQNEDHAAGIDMADESKSVRAPLDEEAAQADESKSVREPLDEEAAQVCLFFHFFDVLLCLLILSFIFIYT